MIFHPPPGIVGFKVDSFRLRASPVVLRLATVLFGAASLWSVTTSEAQAPAGDRQPVGPFALSAVRDGVAVDPVALELHLADTERLTHHILSTWTAESPAPMPGEYDLWLEGEAEVSADQQPVVSSAGRLRLAEQARPFHIVPAGQVALAPQVELSNLQAVRLVTLASREDQHLPRYGFSRWITAAESELPASLPEGSLIALLFDRETREVRSISSPIETARTEPTLVTFGPREGERISVLALLDVPAEASRPAEEELSLWLASEEGRRPPDVVTTLEGSLVGVWYRVEGRIARIEAATEHLFLEPVELSVAGAGVRTVRGILKERPFLDVRIDLPPDLPVDESRLSVARVEGRQIVAEAQRARQRLEIVRFKDLPPEELLVTLRLVGGVNWVMREVVDLRGIESAEVVFQPLRFVVAGRLFHGEEPTPGTLRLFTDQQKRDSVVTVEADEEGLYEIPLFSPGRFPIQVSLPGLIGSPPFKLWTPYFESDSTFDIHVPRATATVLVRDRRNGEPIEGADVIYDSTRIPNGVVTGGTSGVVTTGAEGGAVLPPVARGRLTVRAVAEGYLAVDPVEVVVEDEGSQEVVLELDPIAGGAKLSLDLTDGRPAADAEVRAQRVGWNEPPMWQGRADRDGGIEIPSSVAGGWLLVRHPEAGSWIQGWTGEAGSVWVLPPRGGRLSLRSVGLDGMAQPWSSLAVRFPRAWVAGASLAWLAGTMAGSSDGEGFWTTESLPATDLAAIAGSPDRIRLVLQGLLDGSARPIPPPWPATPVEVEAIR